MASKDNILKAIDLAQGRRSCTYVDHHGQPCCVIAQLASLEGIPIEEMTKWSTVYANPTISTLFDERNVGSTALGEYDYYLLSDLQRVWDGREVVEPNTDDAARERMREYVKRHYS